MSMAEHGWHLETSVSPSVSHVCVIPTAAYSCFWRIFLMDGSRVVIYSRLT